MPWFKVDDHIYSHPGWVSLSAGAKALWVEAGAYASLYCPDGFLPKHCLRLLNGKPRFARELVEHDFWEDVGDEWMLVPSPRGSARVVYQINAGDLREKIPAWMRRAVIERDGLLCGLCDGEVEPDDVHLDHIVPVSLGGQNVVSNLQVAHSRCNMSKGNRA